MQKHVTNSEKETFNLAKKLAKEFKGGEVIGLEGNLGAGKTVFVKGLAAGLGIKEVVNSPTFVLMKVYNIENLKFKIVNLVHVDAYRINDSQELIGIGLEDYMGRKDTVTVIEWADKVKDILTKDATCINLRGKNNKRQIVIKKYGRK